MFKFKKIASLLASTLLIGTTMGLAANAANYPAPFVTGGSPNVGIVYGSGAAIQDLVAATNIMDNLNTFVVSGSTGATGGTVTGGDFVILAKSSDNLNVGNTWGVFTGTVDKDDLKTLLAAGTYSADDNDAFAYEQKILLGAPNFTYFSDTDYDDLIGASEKTPTLGFQIPSGTFIMNYTIDFTTDAETDIVSGDADDIEGSDLMLMGKKYYMSDAKLNGPVSFWGKLTLLDSADRGTVKEGETVTLTVGNSSYDVTVDFIDNDEVVFMVNGERAPSSGKLAKGGSYKLNDGSFIGVVDISRLEVSGELGSSTFSIGTGKLEITSDAEVKLNDKAIEGLKGYVYNASGGSSTVAKLDKIELEWITNDEEFLSPVSELTLPGFNALKFSMNDFVRPEEEIIKIENDADKSIKLTAPIKDGTVSFNILYSNSSGEFTGIGKDDNNRLATVAPNATQLTFFEKANGEDYHEWFVASYNISGQAESALLKAKVTKDSNGKNKTTVSKKIGGDWSAVCEDKLPGDTCDVTSLISLTITDVNYSSANEGTAGNNRSVLFTAGTNVNFQTLYTAGGLRIYLPFVIANGSAVSAVPGMINATGLGILNRGQAGTDQLNISGTTPNGFTHALAQAGNGMNTWRLVIYEEDKDDNIAAGRMVNITLDDNSDGDLHPTQVDGTGTAGSLGKEVGDSSRIYEAYITSDVATKIMHTVPSSGKSDMKVYYPSGDSESYAEVFLTESDAVVAGGGGGGGGGSTVGVPMLDSEASSVTGKNLIVVGGSCVNTLAAQLLGSSTPLCGADFTTSTNVGANQFLIETFSRSGGNVATLVAGYNAGDTTNAATYLRTQTGVMTDVGKKYVGTSATSAELVTTTA